MELTKEVLKFIYQSETEDAVLVLENCLDFTLSSRSEQGIISVNLKAKETTIKAVKDIIAAHGLEGLEAKETIKKINREIKSLIFSKKVIHSGNTSDKPISEPPPLSTPTGGGSGRKGGRGRFSQNCFSHKCYIYTVSGERLGEIYAAHRRYFKFFAQE